MRKNLDYQGVTYTILENFGDLKTVKNQQEEIFILVAKRGLLLSVKDNEPNFHRASGSLFLHGIPFKRGRIEKKEDYINLSRNCTTTKYKGCTVIFFLSDDMKEIDEIMCPQFG